MSTTAELHETLSNCIVNHTAEQSIELRILRDLAVQIVGSDAGKAKRFRPTGTMAKGISVEELAEVESLMQPFLEAEIHRYHENRSHRMQVVEVNASHDQAFALLKLCTSYADHLQGHWHNKGEDPRHHRSKQRLDQARDLIRQINVGLGLGDHDGRGTVELRGEIVTQLRQLDQQLGTFLQRAQAVTADNPEDHRDPAEVNLLRTLQDDLQLALDDLRLYDEPEAATPILKAPQR